MPFNFLGLRYMCHLPDSRRRLDNKLADFKADVRQAQDDAAAKAVSRVRHEKSYPYKKKSHEEQARFNNEVEQCIHEAQEGMAAVEEFPALKRAKEALEKGAQLLTERQKLIKITNRSENGWDPMVLEDVTEIPPGSLTARLELEACEPDSMGEVVVKGRLKKHISFWKEEIKAPAAILDTIEVGYILPLKFEPTPYFRANHQSTSEHFTYVQESVASTGCVTEVHTRPFICSPLSVVVGRSGKERLVINLRHLNKFLWKQKFKYEDLRVAMLLFDLKRGGCV